MIITAENALKLAKISKSLGKKSIRQLKKIDRKINQAARKGKTSINYWNSLDFLLQVVLIEKGYKICEKSTYDYEWVVISWD